MLILFVRTIILYSIVLIAFRLTGKRQISDLQPFDLIITLLIADLASEPAADMGIPLIYGIVPILALFLLQQIISYLSLKSDKFRSAICGKPLIVIRNGVLVEQALRSSRYSISDLMEQMRAKDVFELSSVEYAILETNGDISVLKKGAKEQPTYEAMNLPIPKSELPYMLVHDGCVEDRGLDESGYNKAWLDKQLKNVGIKSVKDVFFAFLNSDGMLHIQNKERAGAGVYFIDVKKGKNK